MQISQEARKGIELMNYWGSQRKPFLFVIDYAMKEPMLFPLEDIDPGEIAFSINGFENYQRPQQPVPQFVFEKKPVSFDTYHAAFDEVVAELRYGNSFLLNLTFSTPVKTNLSLREVFLYSKAKYRLYVRNRFVVFSPESFVRIRKGRISSYPMKGTIDASIPDAARVIMENAKERAEHITIVDLIRNDLSQVAENVEVVRFRYLDTVKTQGKTLLQVSSEISGMLAEGYHKRLGDIFYKLLPAGSITGAPKPKTVEILTHAESHHRGFFTGVFGYFDGMDLESGVMIRFLEQQENGFVYKSGGGITAQSNVREEYQEMIDKVYVPVH